jgi:hypothetical protein
MPSKYLRILLFINEAFYQTKRHKIIYGSGIEMKIIYNWIFLYKTQKE